MTYDLQPIAKEKLKMTGKSGHRRVSANFYEKFEIPNINLIKQKEIVSKIEAVEAKITKIKNEIANTEDIKKEILEKHLQ